MLGAALLAGSHLEYALGAHRYAYLVPAKVLCPSTASASLLAMV